MQTAPSERPCSPGGRAGPTNMGECAGQLPTPTGVLIPLTPRGQVEPAFAIDDHTSERLCSASLVSMPALGRLL